MALIATRKMSLLDSGYILVPERYDPRRELDLGVKSIPLGDIVQTITNTVQPSGIVNPCIVLDTSDAREGIVVCRKHPTTDIGSSKKSIKPGDVLISRLRPYLRQVAYIDDMIPNSGNATLLCSTEFFVLRSQDKMSIAFIVPFLLSKPVQEVFAASQEGGHHPRFGEFILLNIPIPLSLFARREVESKKVDKAVKMYRQSEQSIDRMVEAAELSFLGV